MDTTLVILQFIPFAVVLVLANMGEENSAFRVLTYLALALLNLFLVGIGLLAFLGAALGAANLAGQPLSPQAINVMLGTLQVMGIVGVLGFLPLLRPVRVALARLLPIDPDSAVHMTALVYAIYLVGVGIGQQPLLTNADVLSELDMGVTFNLVWGQAIGMLIVAVPGVGAFIRRNWRETLDRFGLGPLPLSHLAVAIGAMLGLFGLQIAVMLAWQALDPAGFAALDAANNLLLGELTGVRAALVIGLSAAVSEELIFRGALQPRFGLLLTALLFTILHSQYGFSPATILILFIALVLGLLRERTNLTVCILVHFGYNFLSVILASLTQGQF